jgi:general secretion pathway protein K
MLQVSELARVRGFDATVVKRLSPYITTLPARTKLNMNSALPEIIRAYFPEVTENDATALVSKREEQPFKDLADIKKQSELKSVPATSIDQFAAVTSQFFSVSIAISRQSTQVRQTALLRSAGTAGTRWPSIIWVNSF